MQPGITILLILAFLLSVLTLILFAQVWFLSEKYEQRGLADNVVTSLTNKHLFQLLGISIQIANIFLLLVFSEQVINHYELQSAQIVIAFAGELVLGSSLLSLTRYLTKLSREAHASGQHCSSIHRALLPLFCMITFLAWGVCSAFIYPLAANFTNLPEEMMIIINCVVTIFISFVCTQYIPSLSVCLGTLLRLLRLSYGVFVYYKKSEPYFWLAAVIEGLLISIILFSSFILTNVRYSIFHITYELSALEDKEKKIK